MDRPLEQSTWASSSDKDLALFENNSLQANCKSEALTLSMAKEVGEVAKRLGATFVDLHTALMCPDVNLRAALRLEASNEQRHESWRMFNVVVIEILYFLQLGADLHYLCNTPVTCG